MNSRPATRRRMLFRGVAGLACLAASRRQGDADTWHNIDITNSLPALSFTLTRATDGKNVSQADYKGQVVLLYFGYTHCPDVCPLTLSNLARVLAATGPLARHVRVLFVTVDLARDDLATLKTYTAAFGGQFNGMRGTPEQLAELARRYRIAYSVTPTAGGDEEVTHSAAVYAFDATGQARLLIPSLNANNPDIGGTAADLRRLVAPAASIGWLGWLRRLM